MRQTFPLDKVSIIIADDGSTEPIGEIADSFSASLPIQYVRLERSGRAVARNRGVRHGQGDVLVFCDADRIPRARFLEAHSNAMRQHREAIVVGQIREMYVPDLDRNEQKAREQAINEKKDRITQYCKLIYHLFNEQGKTASPIAWIATMTGNLSLPRSLFERVGGFDEGFKEWGFEHFEFGFRAAEHRIPFYYCSQAINVHLAHPRVSHSYVEHIRSSHAYFFNKHNHPAVEKLLGFMLGEISLPQFEAYASGEMPLIALTDSKDDSSWYVRIQNF